ncbi:glycerophosphoryl diester phosphodiesterase membrane domain-containing protein [Streptomyces sp. NPDC088725]|uniref:DUF7544 domain-containing protein n=1 Tax=Streptomyces sp. NPDC088725 TaxID=3365873 RepID=UPI0038191DD7
MNDTPGWASPGSAPSDGQESGVPQPAGPADETGSSSKWSKAQPPAGQWSPPSGPAAGPPVPRPPRARTGGPGPSDGGAPGWGGPGPGWGNGAPGWGRPPAAKPGVIPLRPLGVGEILDGAVSTLRAHWRTVLGVTVTIAVITQLGNLLAQRFLMTGPSDLGPNPTAEQAMDEAVRSVRSSLLVTLPNLALTLIGTLLTTAILTVVISRSVLGRPVTFKEAWAEATPRIPRLLGLTLILPLMGGVILAIGILPGVLIGFLAEAKAAGAGVIVLGALAGFAVVLWLMIRFALASPALMLERQGVVASLRRSAKLVRGAWWRTFGILALTVLMTFVFSLIIGIPFSAIAIAVDGGGFGGLLSGTVPDYGWAFLIITGIGGVVSASITLPVSAGVTVLLYVDQRIRREALDIELARAAGIPGYGRPGDDIPGS